MKVCVVTPTGDRPELFALLRKCVEAQTRIPDLWIVSTDTGEPMDSLPLPDFGKRLGFTREHIEATPCFDKSNRNLALALTHVPFGYHVVIMEDDDYYGPNYIETIMSGFRGDVQLVGNRTDYRYHMCLHRWKIVEKPMPNAGCSAITSNLCTKYYQWLTDPKSTRAFWDHVPHDYENLARRISIKGAGYCLPGRPGNTHNPNNQALSHWPIDIEPYATLRKWIGSAAEPYISLCR